MKLIRIFGAVLALFVMLPLDALAASAIEGQVKTVVKADKTFQVEVLQSDDDRIATGEIQQFRVSRGDLQIGYEGRSIKANASYYNNAWHLEQIFPLDGEGAREATLVNRILSRSVANMKRREFLREGDTVPNFALIDQDGEFFQIEELRGHPFVVNFIFTRCAVPKMCPASSTKMAELQEKAKTSGLDALHFVTISFDPEFDSPGILRTYAQSYGMDLENFHLLTGSKELIDDLLRLFGILTIEEDGTINHTIATLLVDAEGRVSYREEGPAWKVQSFLDAASELNKEE